MCEKFMNIKPNTLLAIFWLQFKLKEQKCQAALFFFVCLFLFTGKAKLSLTGVWSLPTCFKQGFSAILCFYRLMFCQVSVLVFWHLLYLCWNTSTVFLVSNFSVSNFLHITYICFAFLLLLGCNISVSNLSGLVKCICHGEGWAWKGEGGTGAEVLYSHLSGEDDSSCIRRLHTYKRGTFFILTKRIAKLSMKETVQAEKTKPI